jgi:hypothetical protein
VTALEKVPTGIGKARRNLIKVGAIAVSAMFRRLANAQLAAPAPGPGPGPGPRGPQCFLKGAIIRTAIEDRKIEDLAVGDLLPTVFGGHVPFKWIGLYSLKKSDPTKGWVKKVLPVRVDRSAVGLDVPCPGSPLAVSEDLARGADASRDHRRDRSNLRR